MSMFLDTAKISVQAGRGGDGMVAFRREKYVPNGGPWGGDGGKGGSVIFKVDEGLRTLMDFRYNRKFKAKNGEKGMTKGMHGRGAEDLIVSIPPGTTVRDAETGKVITDMVEDGQEFVVAHGGRGGRGNIRFATPRNPAPEIAENGEPGEERRLKVELKLLADVGFVGMPSVGKSTLISKISKAKPKIAEYHFTTLSPNLGVVKTIDNRVFVAADLPGLIKGASLGEGLGDKFLRHAARTKVIAHIIDMSAYEGRDPYEDYITIRKELGDFDKKLLDKPEVIIANKMDMESAKENLKEFKKKVNKEVFEISALTGEGIDKVLVKIADELDNIKDEPLYENEQFEKYVLYKFKEEKPYRIYKDNDVYVVSGDEIEKLLRMTKFTDEGARRFAKKLRRMGVDEDLQKMGIQEGDTVRILDFEFEYKE